MSLLDDLFSAPPSQAPAAPMTVQLVQPTELAKEPEPQGLDQFKDFWKTPEGYKPPENFDPTQLHAMKPEDFQKAVGSLDFTQGIDPTHLQAIAAGGEDAVKALAPILRHVAQSVYANSTMTTTKLIENAISKTVPSIDSKIDQRLRGHDVTRALSEANPLFTNPATAAFLAPLKEQLMIQYPNATPSELAEHAKNYLAQLAGAAAPASQTTQPGAVKETDWEKYFTDPVQRG